jgi:nucleoside-diphosphate-sugar epimerase
LDFNKGGIAIKVLITGGSGFIGIHLVDLLHRQNYTVMNLDITPPINGRHLDLWTYSSVTEREQFVELVKLFNPTFIIHLSATTTQNAKSLDEFAVNIEGTKNLILAANSLTNLKKLIFTSTQYVNTPGNPYSHDLAKLTPYGLYGASKLMGEQLIRGTLLCPSWTIIRPTNIWGPWHPILVNGLWTHISKGRYLHPSNDEAIKAYGYVENTAWQIEKILQLEGGLTNGKTLYLADANIAQREWVRAFVQRLTKKEMREIPRVFLLLLSEIGEVLSKTGISFPLYKSRYRNLVTSNPSPLEETLATLGSVPIKFDDAVNRTCEWLEMELKLQRENTDIYE